MSEPGAGGSRPARGPGRPGGAATVDLAVYLRVARRAWLPVTVAGLAGLVVGLVLTVLTPPVYTASARVFAPATPTYLALDIAPGAGGGQPPPREWTQDTEAELLRSDVVLSAVARRLDLSGDPSALADRIELSVPTSARVFTITFTATTATEARDGAQAVAEEYVRARSALLADRTQRVSAMLRDQRANLEALLTGAPRESGPSLPTSDPGAPTSNPAVEAQIRDQINRIDLALAEAAKTSANTASVVTPASLPPGARRTNPEVPPVSGLMLGLLSGLGASVAYRRRGGRVRDVDDAADATGLAVLAALGRDALTTDTPALDRLVAELGETFVQVADDADAGGRGAAPIRLLVTGWCADRHVTALATALRSYFPAPAGPPASDADPHTEPSTKPHAGPHDGDQPATRRQPAPVLAPTGIAGNATVDTTDLVVDVTTAPAHGATAMARDADVVLVAAEIGTGRHGLVRLTERLRATGVLVQVVALVPTGAAATLDLPPGGAPSRANPGGTETITLVRRRGDTTP